MPSVSEQLYCRAVIVGNRAWGIISVGISSMNEGKGRDYGLVKVSRNSDVVPFWDKLSLADGQKPSHSYDVLKKGCDSFACSTRRPTSPP